MEEFQDLLIEILSQPVSKFGVNLYGDQVNNPDINSLAKGGRAKCLKTEA